MAPVKTKKGGKPSSKKFVIDASGNVGDMIDIPALEKYLVEHIKVDGRTGNLGNQVTVSADGSKVYIISTTKFSGHYVKYLTKKFLKKYRLREWIRIVASSKNVYQFRFFNLVVPEDEDEE